MEEETPSLRQKNIHKRRSSIFQRRSLLLTATDNAAEELDETKSRDDNSSFSPSKKVSKLDTGTEKPFVLQEYIDYLKHEKQTWHEVLQERRAQNRNLTKKKAALEKTGQEVDLSVLLESERNFIEARPNYENIVKSSKALVDMAVKVAVLNQHCNRLYENLNSKIEEKIKDATKKIISMVD